MSVYNLLGFVCLAVVPSPYKLFHNPFEIMCELVVSLHGCNFLRLASSNFLGLGVLLATICVISRLIVRF